MTRPRVILHIGRNKAGSTTIQDWCVAHAGALAAEGIDYLLFGHLWDSRPDVPGCRLFEEVAARRTRAPDRTILISNEFLSMWPDEYTLATRTSLVGCDVRVLVYLRRCDDWMRSSYAEVTHKGMNRRDFDAYFADLAPRASALPNLAAWATCFGWPAITVRILDPAALLGGDLIEDFAAAIGLRRRLPTVTSSNVSPHWCELELARALTTQDSDEEWGGAARAAVQPLAALMADLARDVPPVRYLTLAQRAALEAVWESDLAEIGRRIGQPLAAMPAPAAAEREQLPSLALVPAPVMARFLAAAAAADFASRHPAASAAAAALALVADPH